ncbi:unnamed protein product [Moneuplotes crassus]|uniref:RING-type domain-containing protein n=1 Tax=Euplotes crassus TaxID=5936 RepID=A0AAD1UEC2_EUPCR|nr:unnamed protein product [Moneuplotes crassus]
MVLDFIMNRAHVYYIEYVNPLVVLTSCLVNPIIAIYYFFKYTENAALLGPWLMYSIIIHMLIYVWQMTRPLTNHPNQVRTLVRKTLPKEAWRIIFCRMFYKKNLQDQCWWWFSYTFLLVSYFMFVVLWVLDVVSDEYSEDRLFMGAMTFVIITSFYNLVASISLVIIIMIVIMMLMIVLLIICFPCIILCQDCMSWRPRNNGDVDREEFKNLVNNRNHVQDVLLYIFRNKKSQYRTLKNKISSTEESKKNYEKGDKWNIPTQKSGDDKLYKANEMDKRNAKIHPLDHPTIDPDMREDLEEEFKADSLNQTKIENEEKHRKRKKKPVPIEEDEICVVCQDEFTDDAWVIELDCDLARKKHRDSKGCKHIFHSDCLREWLRVKMACPTCRTNPMKAYKTKIKTVGHDFGNDFPDKIYAEDIRTYMNQVNNIFDQIANEPNNEGDPLSSGISDDLSDSDSIRANSFPRNERIDEESLGENEVELIANRNRNRNNDQYGHAENSAAHLRHNSRSFFHSSPSLEENLP